MREIKFRAWNELRRQMILPPPDDEQTLNPWLVGFNGMIHKANGEDLEKNTAECLQVGLGLHLMQYTGLKDKNGVEIYEGDIVKFSFPEKDGISVVVWGYGEWNVTDFKSPISESIYNASSLEVVGNVYENPELVNTQ